MRFTIVSRITNAEVIGTGQSGRIRRRLMQKFGTWRWRTMKGEATIPFDDGALQHNLGEKDVWFARPTELAEFRLEPGA